MSDFLSNISNLAIRKPGSEHNKSFRWANSAIRKAKRPDSQFVQEANRYKYKSPQQSVHNRYSKALGVPFFNLQFGPRNSSGGRHYLYNVMYSLAAQAEAAESKLMDSEARCNELRAELELERAKNKALKMQLAESDVHGER